MAQACCQGKGLLNGIRLVAPSWYDTPEPLALEVMSIQRSLYRVIFSACYSELARRRLPLHIFSQTNPILRWTFVSRIYPQILHHGMQHYLGGSCSLPTGELGHG
jgi:hypothetical protein